VAYRPRSASAARGPPLTAPGFPDSIPHIVEIPRKIHQIWLQGKDNIPQRYRLYQKSWQKNHPDWEHLTWDDRKIRGLLASKFPWFLETYDSYSHLHQKVDSGRYFILYEHGGFYADIDTKSIKPLDLLLREYQGAGMIVSRHPFSRLENTLLRLILGTKEILTIGIIGVVRRFYVWESILPLLAKRCDRFSFIKELNITFSTGPAFFSIAIDDNLRSDGDIKVLPHHYFESRFGYDTTRGYGEFSFVEHTQDATWHSGPLRYLFNKYFVLKNLFTKD
jgi:mannosyltransferase OCH1-like enzyme